MKKLKKIKWLNLAKLLLLLFVSGIILHDFYELTFKFACFTWFGLGTHILCWFIVGAIYDDFEEQIKKMSTTRNS